MTTATATTFSSVQDTLTTYGLNSVDFTFNNDSGIDFTVMSLVKVNNDGTVQETTKSLIFDYNNDEHVDSIKQAVLIIVDDAFPEIDNIIEVGGTIAINQDGHLYLEGNILSSNSIIRLLNN